jgi:hypothetical protein
MFSQAVQHVAGTKIFARLDGDEQLLAYEMSFGAAGDLAMVLPVPVRQDLAPSALRFVDLSGYPELFSELARLFPRPQAFGGPIALMGRAQPALEVHRVGAFEASYVPAPADFARLDRRFQLDATVWDALPEYRDFGFAVFKLRGTRRGLLERLGLAPAHGPSTQKVHPMALAFRTRTPGELFFPTVHVHDARVHPKASFDHEIYCQLDGEPQRSGFWERATEPLQYDQVQRGAGLLRAGTPLFRQRLLGELPNRDVRAGVANGQA